MSVESNPELHFFFTSLRDWFRIFAPLSQPIRCITKTTFSRALGSLVVFTLGSHWLLKIFSFIHIGRKALKLRLASCACMRTSTQVFELTTLNRQKDENQLKNLTISLFCLIISSSSSALVQMAQTNSTEIPRSQTPLWNVIPTSR